MRHKRFDDTIGGDEERTILSGNRRSYPGVEIIYLKEEEWKQGRIYISISRDSEAMTCDQMEIFIAMFRKVIEVAQRKEKELNAVADSQPWGEMPQVEMNFYNTCPAPENIMFIVSDMGGSFSVNMATQFADLMDNLLAKAREIEKFPTV